MAHRTGVFRPLRPAPAGFVRARPVRGASLWRAIASVLVRDLDTRLALGPGARVLRVTPGELPPAAGADVFDAVVAPLTLGRAGCSSFCRRAAALVVPGGRVGLATPLGAVALEAWAAEVDRALGAGRLPRPAPWPASASEIASALEDAGLRDIEVESRVRLVPLSSVAAAAAFLRAARLSPEPNEAALARFAAPDGSITLTVRAAIATARR